MATAAAAKRSRYSSPRATYGSVAYDLDYAERTARPLRGGEEVLQPRPMVRPRERAVARPRIKTREAGKVSLFAVVGFLAVGVFAVLLIMSCIQLNTYSDEIAGLKTELSSLQSEETKLRTQYELAFDLASIETAVTSNGSMVKPQSGQILYMDLSEPDSVVVFHDKETPVEGAGGLWAGVQEILGNMVEYFK